MAGNKIHCAHQGRGLDGSQVLLTLALLCLAGLTVLANWPGHISVDAVIQLSEGRSGVYDSFNPPFMGFVMGLLDTIKPGAQLFFLLDIGIFFSALYLFLRDRPQHRSWSLALLGVACLAPVLLIYNGTIWKDVFFANLSLLGFACLATEEPGKRRVLGAALCFAMVILVRQQGPLIALCGALCYALQMRDQGVARTLLRTVIAFALVYLLSKAILWLVLSMIVSIRDPSLGTGLSVLLLYDISGMTYAYGPEILTVFAKAGLDVPQITSEVLQHYSDSRQDFLRLDEMVHVVASFDLLKAQWWHAVTEHPLGYLLHRARVFSWLLGVHDPALCAPVHLGVNGPASLSASMHLDGFVPSHKGKLWDYAEHFFAGPLFRPWIYVLLAIGLVAGLVRKINRASDRALLLLLTAGIGYVGSYYFFSMACDFRYTYLLVMAVYVALALCLPGWVAAAIARYRTKHR